MKDYKVALFVNASYKLGGAERRLCRIFKALGKYINADILILQRKQNDEISDNYKLYQNNNTNILFANNLGEIFKYMYNGKYSWICCFSPTFRNAIVFFFALFFRTKCLFSSVSTSCSNLQFKSVLEKVRFYTMILLANKVDCLYPSSTKILKKAFPFKEIYTTDGSFTDLNIFSPSNRKDKNIVYAASMIPIKNPELMASVIVYSQHEIRDSGFHCIICGDGPLLGSVKKVICDGECNDIVSFTGNIPLQHVLANSKIFCSLQSISNYPSQALLEAMACGCYCIATNGGDTHLMIDDSFGKLVSYDIVNISQALINAMAIPNDKYDSISKASKKLISKKFTIENSVNYFIDLLEVDKRRFL